MGKSLEDIALEGRMCFWQIHTRKYGIFVSINIIREKIVRRGR